MKIHQVRDEGQNIQPINQGIKPSPSEKNSAAPNIGSPASVSDRVELSPQSRDMKKIHEILAATPEIRTEKVAALKQAIDPDRGPFTPIGFQKLVRHPRDLTPVADRCVTTSNGTGWHLWLASRS